MALISLVVAITALSYTTWRNELAGHNRNVRASGIEIHTELAKFQLIVEFRHYDADPEAGNPIQGWAGILLIRDLTRIMPDEVRESAGRLYDTWRSSWQDLGTDEDAVKRIDDSRAAVLAALKARD